MFASVFNIFEVEIIRLKYLILEGIVDIKKLTLICLCLVSKVWCSESVTTRMGIAKIFAREKGLVIQIPENDHEQYIWESTKHQPDQPTMQQALMATKHEERPVTASADRTHSIMQTITVMATTSVKKESWLPHKIISHSKSCHNKKLQNDHVVQKKAVYKKPQHESYSQEHGLEDNETFFAVVNGKEVEFKPYVKKTQRKISAQRTSAFDVENARTTNPW
ncbi:hypothetical protein KBD08_03165 [Candidatus Babeliales bacterium]|nr:hypothetical protein [Candidatus Babeliales bacterium]